MLKKIRVNFYKRIEKIDTNKVSDKELCNCLNLLSLEELWNITSFLNNKDKDIIYLLLFSKKKKSVISEILNRKRNLITYDVKRIFQRIKFISWLDQVYPKFINFLERNPDLDTQTKESLVFMFFTTNYSQSANLLGVRQLIFRYRFKKSLKILQDMKEEEILGIFKHIIFNINIIKRTYKSYV